MKKKIWIPLLFVTAILVIITSQYPKTIPCYRIWSKMFGFRNICCWKRRADGVIENDLDYSFVKYTSSKINYKEKSVTTSLFGLAKQKAIYREGLGCCLVDDSGFTESRSAYSLQKKIADSILEKKLA